VPAGPAAWETRTCRRRPAHHCRSASDLGGCGGTLPVTPPDPPTPVMVSRRLEALLFAECDHCQFAAFPADAVLAARKPPPSHLAASPLIRSPPTAPRNPRHASSPLSRARCNSSNAYVSSKLNGKPGMLNEGVCPSVIRESVRRWLQQRPAIMLTESVAPDVAGTTSRERGREWTR
jgi:hypothetical protein